VYCPEALMGVQTSEEIYDMDAVTANKGKAYDLTDELNEEE
jgi:hypothetical protein